MKACLRNRKAQLVLIAALFVIVLSVSSLLNFPKGLELNGAFFRKVSDGEYRLNRDNYVILAEDNRLTAVLEGVTYQATLEKTGGRLRFTYDDGNVLEGSMAGGQLVDDRGMPLWMREDNEIVVIHTDNPPEPLSRAHLSEALYHMSRGESEHREGAWYALLLFVVLYAIGAVTFFFPEQTAFFLSRWQYKQPELSDAGRMVQQVGGVLFMLFGTIVAFLPQIL